ncbi:uncharacterized protein DUF397 [Streptomyces sp. KhCrAH-43]|uniref:DUF397 domain-containing protein n=1 Tax=unclassified Streptomyces TaxID=2593676 RepID=UPI00035DD823|nr:MULTISPECIES: DUF397 domain-containing protein [unclassified Streptomyces]MYS32916.1 DUF397 domain-containing protein [Streptomyces sp. SID4920]MYX64293.1 DUF397 domain-containing protein [Streptomyces sp. SID8373]RAJ48659.1 uncharacterized protein DUF397 [Streptomyces sp. KhCrAH-43]
MAHLDDGPQTGDWFTSSYSDNQGGQCVQARRLAAGPASMMAVRDSKDPESGTFVFDRAVWMDFVAFAAGGEPPR